MSNLFTSWNLKGLEIKNRICVPPMVCFGWSDDAGYVSEKHVNHYREMAKGGYGLIIQEATCINRQGRLSGNQLGIWDDAQIPGLKKIVDAVHESGTPIFVQIHHAGVISSEEDRVCPSEYTVAHKNIEKHARELTVDEIHVLEEEYIQAVRRAYEAGYDGVELHGCHSYLLSQFMNRRVNKRTDEYNADDMLIVKNILEGIRNVVPEEFVVGIRLGAFEPTIEDGIAHAKWLEEHGIDFIDVSYGFSQDADEIKPEDYPFAKAIYGGKRIKEAVSVPVFAVYGIQNGAMAEAALEDTKADMIDIGRGVLVNYQWANDVKEGKDPGKCLYCAKCIWRAQTEVCAGKVLMQKNR